MDQRHVGHTPQALHALSLPGPHRLGQNLELQVLPLSQVLALSLSVQQTQVKEVNRKIKQIGWSGFTY